MNGGFFLYRCKYFLTHNCPSLLYVNNAPCAACCAAGREDDEAEVPRQSKPGRGGKSSRSGYGPTQSSTGAQHPYYQGHQGHQGYGYSHYHYPGHK